MTAPRLPQLLGALALLTAMGGVGWRAAGQYEASRLVSVTASATPAAAFSRGPALGARAPSPSERTPTATVAQTTTPPLAPGEIEVCGFGRAPAGSPAAEQLAARANEGLDLALARHLRRMAASNDERTRAAGLMALGETAPLVAMATRTRDPTVFAFAQQACLDRDPKNAGSPCALVGEEQGARLDPDNGAAWLKVADTARLRGETDNMVAALRRVAGSSMHEAREFAFFALATDAVPPSMGATDRLRLSIGLIGVQAALALPSHLAVTTYCTEVLARDINRRPLCDALAEHLVAHGSLLIHLGIGARMGERAGWSAERVERVRARVHAMGVAQPQAIEGATGGPVACEALRISERWWSDSARYGERAVAEQLLAQESDAQLIERYRNFQRQLAAAASAPR